jgi:hypothetical protein
LQGLWQRNRAPQRLHPGLSVSPWRWSPGSYWPFGIAASAAVTGLGLVFFWWWLIGVGLIAVILSSCALLFEYYTGTRRMAEH